VQACRDRDSFSRAIHLLSPGMLTCSPPAIALLSPQHAHLLAASGRSAIPPALLTCSPPAIALLSPQQRLPLSARDPVCCLIATTAAGR
jgi:hypothetical protein